MADFDTDKKIQDFLEKQERWLANGLITQEEYNNAINDAKVGIQGYTAKLKTSGDALKQSFIDLGSSMIKGEQGAGVYNNSIKSGAKFIDDFASKFGILGKIVGTLASAGLKYVAAVNEQADKLFDTYKDLSRSGLANGMRDTFDNLQDMGYTMAEIGKMQGILKENANTLAQFGGTAAEGSKKFASLSKSIVSSDLGTEFQRMGMSIDDINKGIAGYTRIQQISGQLGKQNAEEMRTSAAAFIEKQDQLTKLTGISADAQNKILESAYAEERYNAKQYELRTLRGDQGSKDLADRNDELVKLFAANVGPDAAKELRDYLGGSMNSEDAQKFRRSYGNLADMLDQGVLDVPKLFDRGAKDAAETAKAQNYQAKAGFADKNFNKYNELTAYAGRTHAQLMTEAAEQAKKDRDAQKEGADAGVKNMVGITQNQRNQTQTTDLLTNKGIVPVTEGMAGLSDALTDVTNIVGQLAGRSNVLGGSGGGSTSTAPVSGTTNKITGVESGGANIANRSGPGGTPASSAFGVGQMLKGTFEDLASRAAPGSALAGKTFEDMKKDVNLQKLAVEQYQQDNRAALEKNGIQPTEANLYLAHHLGTTGALRVLKSGDGVAVKDIVSAEAYKSNPNLRSLNTVGDLKQWAASKMASAEATTAKQSAALGGILSGPKSGYQATLHGTEAVVPLPDGKTIPVQIQGNKNQYEQIGLLSAELDKLDTMLRVMQKQNDISQKMLQRQV